jgi:FkbM family methyltransferase
MKKVLLNIARGIIRAIARSHYKLPQFVEMDMKHLQGKGIGADTVKIEATIALNFLSDIGLNDPLVLDIGANIGLYSQAILEANPNSRVFAFEPSEVARIQLENRFANNSNVTIVPLALSTDTTTQQLWSDTLGSGLASLTRRRTQHFGFSFEESEVVEVTTLDSWRRNCGISPNLIKIDVEGHELDVIFGGKETISLANVVQFEFGGCNIDTRTFFQDFWYWFRESGFTIYRITQNKPVLIERYSEEDEYFRTTNYLAVRRN